MAVRYAFAEECRLVPGWTCAPHAHPDFDEIMYVRSGILQATIEDKVYTVPAGHLVWYERGRKHADRQIGEQPLLVTYVGLDLSEVSVRGPALIADTRGRIAMLCAWMGEEVRRGRNEACCDIAIVLAHAVREAGQPASMALMADAQRYASEHMTSISVERLAKHFGFSTSHFSRLFRDHVGLTPQRWLRQQRAQRARMLLITTTMSLPDIARSVGCRDAAELSRFVWRELGMRPSAVRHRR